MLLITTEQVLLKCVLLSSLSFFVVYFLFKFLQSNKIRLFIAYYSYHRLCKVTGIIDFLFLLSNKCETVCMMAFDCRGKWNAVFFYQLCKKKIKIILNPRICNINMLFS